MDSLDNLPIDKTKRISEEEADVLRKYNKPRSNESSKSMLGELKVILLATVLFLLMSTEFFDKRVNFLPYTDSIYVKIGMKGLIYAMVLFSLIVITS